MSNAGKPFVSQAVGFLFSPADDRHPWEAILRAYQVTDIPLEIPGSVRVYLVTGRQAESEGAIPLADFEHPPLATYVLGANMEGGPLAPPPGAVKVSIPTPDTFYELWTSQVAAVVLYDRATKAPQP